MSILDDQPYDDEDRAAFAGAEGDDDRDALDTEGDLDDDLGDDDLDDVELTEHTRDPGAPMEAVGVPEYAADQQPGPGDSGNDPEQFVVPVEEPVVSTSYGTTAAETAAGEGLERKLAREEPDIDSDSWDAAADDPDDPRPAEEAAIRVVEEP
jgi:hypothetical protein